MRLIIDRSTERARAEVLGVGFRLPVTRPIPLSVAAALVSDGVPFVTRFRDSGE